MTKEFRIALIFSIVVVVAACAIVVLWRLPEIQVDSIRHNLTSLEAGQLENDYRVTIAQIIAGLGLLLGVYLTWRRIAATEKQARAFEQQIVVAQDQILVAQDGQITERFTRAIDQLGHEKLEIRLGGIYALERIALDSKKDHWTIMEVLTAYVRENARWKEPAEAESEDGERAEIPTLPADIQAILTVVSRRKREHEEGGSYQLDLGGTDLRRAQLMEAHLEGADLMLAHLEGAVLYSAHLEDAGLADAHLESASLGAAHLENAYLGGAYLEGANLSFANLEGAYLEGAHLEGADLSEANLEGACLSKANLEGAFLFDAHLDGANLTGATSLTREQIDSAVTDDKTKLPDYLIRDQEGGEQEEAAGGGET